MKESEDTSIARIKPFKKVLKPFQIKFEELESFREIEETKQKATTK